jgi:hypothetical protein
VQIEPSGSAAVKLKQMLRFASMRHQHHLLLAACATGLSCSLAVAGPVATPPADAMPLLAQAAVEKASPFAAAKDETGTGAGAASPADAMKELAGTKATGTKKNSPFAAAKESDLQANADLKVDRSRLWWLLLPVGLAAISYSALRSQEGEGEA